MRSRSRIVRARGPKRGLEWFGGATSTDQTVVANSVSAAYIVTPIQCKLWTDPTLVRTRGQLWVTAIGQSIARMGAVGIIAWKDRDATAPAGLDAPDPFVDTDLDWIWHSFVAGSSVATTGIDLQWLGADSIDSKAMRKLGADEGILIAFRNAGTGSDPWQAQWGVRCLFKE